MNKIVEKIRLWYVRTSFKYEDAVLIVDGHSVPAEFILCFGTFARFFLRRMYYISVNYRWQYTQLNSMFYCGYTEAI